MEHVGMEYPDDFNDGFEDGSTSVLAYGIVAFSGFLIGLLATWIF